MRGRTGLLANDEAAELQLKCAKDQLKWLNDLMGTNKYICGDRYTICDIVLFGQVWFFCINPAFGAPLGGALMWEAGDLDIPWVKVRAPPEPTVNFEAPEQIYLPHICVAAAFARQPAMTGITTVLLLAGVVQDCCCEACHSQDTRENGGRRSSCCRRRSRTRSCELGVSGKTDVQRWE
jgi:hypothetical protein